MISNNSGCLIFLEKLFILEISTPVNFAKKFLYRRECTCCPYKTKIKKISLREYIKLNCDQNSNSKIKKIPSCYQCSTKLLEDKSYTVYSSHKIMKILVPSSNLENEMELYFDKSTEEDFLRKNKLDEIRAGDEISGLFYLDHLLKYNNENGRLVGNQILHLIAVDVKSGSEVKNRRKLKKDIIKPVNYFENSYKKI